MTVRPAKTQIRLDGSESSQCAHWVAKDPRYLHADSEVSDQTGRMPRLIWVFAARNSFCWFCHVAAHFASQQNISEEAGRERGFAFSMVLNLTALERQKHVLLQAGDIWLIKQWLSWCEGNVMICSPEADKMTKPCVTFHESNCAS